MKFSDYEQLNIRSIGSVVKAMSLPVGSHIKRGKAVYDRFFCNFGASSQQSWNGGTLQIKDCDVVFIPRGLTYTDDYLSEGYSIIIYVDISPEISGEITKWEISDDAEIKQRFIAVFNIWQQKKNGYYIRCMRELYGILEMIIRTEKSRYADSSKVIALKPAYEYMKANFAAQNISIPFLAELCGMSCSYFRKLFFDVYGVSPNAFLAKLRLEYACQLLSLEDYSVTQVAAMSGFSDVYYFSSFFKKHMGMAPSKYSHTPKIKKA